MRRFWTDLWWLLLYVAGGLLVTLGVSAVVMLACAESMTVMLHLVQWTQNVALMVLPAVMWVRYYKKERVRETLRLHWPGWQMMALTALLMVVSLPLVQALAMACKDLPLPEALRLMAEQEAAQQEEVFLMLMKGDGVGSWVAVIALMCVMTAVGEEMLFRGALLRCWVGVGESSRRRWLVAAVWVGVIFGMIHMEVFGMIPRSLLGMLFVALVWRTASLWPAVLAHAMNNLWAVIEMKAAPQWMVSMSEAGWWWVVSAVLTSAVAWMMVRASRRM